MSNSSEHKLYYYGYLETLKPCIFYLFNMVYLQLLNKRIKKFFRVRVNCYYYYIKKKTDFKKRGVTTHHSIDILISGRCFFFGQ